VSEQIIQQVEQFIKQSIPMIAYSGLSIVSVDDEHCTVKIPLKSETKNHLQSMYFGALAVGADGAGGLIAMYQIMKNNHKISLVFKDFQANFLSRAEGDVYFTCRDGKKVSNMIAETLKTGQRVSEPVTIIATTPDTTGDKPVAEFVLTLSLK